ncbi:MAG: sigma-70 family RNA polymerase sigma factor [Clostridia bacterium]|nr:sigma-70 family RNA polymerase sigma factor [Clostridia bacterium]
MIIQLEEEFITMVRENKEDFYRLAYSYVKNEQDALDIVGEATYKAFNSLDKIRERKYMKTWFYKIVINESITLIKKKKNFVYDTQFIETITEEAEDKDKIMDLYNSLDKLSERH